MSTKQVNFSSRLSSRAIIAGVGSTFALMILSLALAGGLGFWSFDIAQLPMLDAGFWVWALTSWVASVYVGSYVAAISSRSTTKRDGRLHGFLTWAFACITGCALIAYAAGQIAGVLSSTNPLLIFGAFIADLVALGAAILAGSSASRSEEKAEAREKNETSLRGRQLEQVFAKPG